VKDPRVSRNANTKVSLENWAVGKPDNGIAIVLCPGSDEAWASAENEWFWRVGINTPQDDTCPLGLGRFEHEREEVRFVEIAAGRASGK